MGTHMCVRHTHKHAHTLPYVCTCAQTHVHMHMHMCPAHTHTHARARIHKLSRTPPSRRYIDFECAFSLNNIYELFIILWIGYFLVAIYVDNVVKNEVGLKRCAARMAAGAGCWPRPRNA